MGAIAVARLESKWRALVLAWESSGLRRDVFAAQHGVNAGTLGWWRTRIRREELAAIFEGIDLGQARRLPRWNPTNSS